MSDPQPPTAVSPVERRLVWVAALGVVVLAGLEIASAGRRGMQVREPTTRRAAEPAEARIDLNRAEAFELEQLPGIGPKRAADIIAWRRTHGPFRRPEDVMRIKGIKEGIFRQIAPHVCVSAPAEPVDTAPAGDGRGAAGHPRAGPSAPPQSSPQRGNGI